MKKDIGKIPAIFPMPVLMIGTYDENGKVDVMNAAWGQVCDNDRIILSLTESHKTVKNIKLNKAFTVALADRAHVEVADYFGIVSGNNAEDKFERTGYHAVKSEKVNAPIIEEFPIVMECELAEIIDTDSIYGVVGKILNTKVEEDALSENGKVDVRKLDALMFDQFQSGYYTVGEKVAMAWNAGLDLAKRNR
jgi:flavin reductase (DIM6/NTAB) family NADH-FMN oxidoreductase RutF